MSETFIIISIIAASVLPLIGYGITILLKRSYTKVFVVEIAALSGALLLSIVSAIFYFGFRSGTMITDSINWFTVPLEDGMFSLSLGVSIDSITILMAITVLLISFLVHIYSIEYMGKDNRKNSYFAFLGLFTFSMLGIVLSDNLLQLYIFWELVGLSSYLLIGFWREKKSANNAANKAFIINRIGDIALLAGIIIVYVTYGSFEYTEILAKSGEGIYPFGSELYWSVSGLLLFIGAMGKSAQFPLHIWLPDAMEGPTPVSALIHAATMVTAGVYFSIRMFPFFSESVSFIIAVIGSLSALLAAMTALFQNDIKKILAYSTISQLGFMMLAIGMGAVHYAFFHLITHAFFKAGLFLGAGAILVATHNVKDIRLLSGLRKKLPIVFVTFMMFSLAISGVPFSSGFLSKDGIIASTLIYNNDTGVFYFSVIAILVTFLSPMYIFRLFIKLFFGEPSQHAEKISPPGKLIQLPLIILAFFSVFVIYSVNPLSSEQGWFFSSIALITSLSGIITGYAEKINEVHAVAMILSVLFSSGAILLTYMLYHKAIVQKIPLRGFILRSYTIVCKGFYLDYWYSGFGRLLQRSADYLFVIEKKVIDGFVNSMATLYFVLAKLMKYVDEELVDDFVLFVSSFALFLGRKLQVLQVGSVQSLIAYFVAGLILIFLFLEFSIL